MSEQMESNSIRSALFLTTFATLVLLTLSGCESTSDETAAQAQSCIDSASTGTQAAKCMTLVAGRTDTQAYQIICSGMFLEWGFSTARFATLIQTVTNNNNGQNAALNMLVNLPLTGTNPITGATASADVVSISSVCQATNSPGLTMLSQYLVIATNVATLSGVTFTSGGQLDINSAKSALAALTSNTATAAAIGQAASTIYTDYCGSGTGDQTVCGAINKAVGGNVTPGSIAVALGQYLQSQ